MAGPGSNFDSEIKKGMRGPSSKSSDGDLSSKPPPASGKQNQWNQPPGPQGQSGTSGGINGDTHAQMIAAGQAHMQAIHNHISAISSGKGAGGDSPVNQGTSAQ